MKPIAKKIEKKAILMLDLIAGIFIMGAAVIVLPVSAFSGDPTLITNIYVWAAVIIGMLFFGSVGYIGFLRPFFLFRKLPDVQAETDGTYLYIHGRKEAKIPLTEMEDAEIDAELPYIMTYEFLVHLFSEQYGKVIIKVPGYGKYKLHYVSGAKEVPAEITELVQKRLHNR